MSAELVIGEEQVDIEKERIGAIDIVVCTPGRLFKHINETPDFVCDNLQILILDEVDRTLDMDFQDEIQQIIQSIPITKVQTLLYSAKAKKSLEKLVKKLLWYDFNYSNLNHYDDKSDNIAAGQGS